VTIKSPLKNEKVLPPHHRCALQDLPETYSVVRKGYYEVTPSRKDTWLTYLHLQTIEQESVTTIWSPAFTNNLSP
jgi:hypothetical protein